MKHFGFNKTTCFTEIKRSSQLCSLNTFQLWQQMKQGPTYNSLLHNTALIHPQSKSVLCSVEKIECNHVIKDGLIRHTHKGAKLRLHRQLVYLLEE